MFDSGVHSFILLFLSVFLVFRRFWPDRSLAAAGFPSAEQLEQTDFTPIRSKITARRSFSENTTFANVIFGQKSQQVYAPVGGYHHPYLPFLPHIGGGTLRHLQGGGVDSSEDTRPIQTNYLVEDPSPSGKPPPQD
ncbi:MAG: hypothetical protein KAJ11_07950 [Alphaproteobacteria bacterium]|nr:hypothetical protein [Alphaproteobacteria bacterium]